MEPADNDGQQFALVTMFSNNVFTINRQTKSSKSFSNRWRLKLPPRPFFSPSVTLISNQNLILLGLTLMAIHFGYVNAVAECMCKKGLLKYVINYFITIYFSAGNKIKCFECNSHEDPLCADPFNWTTLPARKICEGCCVKIIQGLDTRKFFLIIITFNYHN